MSPDLGDRVLPIVLRVDDKAAHEARDFGGVDLRTYVRTHRGEIVHAALVLVRHWMAVGRPAGGVGFPRFEAFGRTVGGILEAAGIEGWLANRGEARERATVFESPLEIDLLRYSASALSDRTGRSARTPSTSPNSRGT